MSTGTNKERITTNNGIINDNNSDLTNLKTKINALPTSGDTTATANDILAGKTAVSKGVKLTGAYTPPTPNLQSKSITITENGTTTVTPDSGYDGLSDVGVSVDVNTGEYNAKALTEITWSEIFFRFANYIKEVPSKLKVKNGFDLNMSQFLKQSLIVTAPEIIFTGNGRVVNMQEMYYGCPYLQNVPIYDTSRVTQMTNTFAYCSRLTNESLNNILQMCINATNITSNKTLKWIGLSSTQATTCQSLSNWDAFVAAGWTSGY